jgi:hypothetical protein
MVESLTLPWQEDEMKKPKPQALHKPLSDALDKLNKKRPKEVKKPAPQLALDLWPDAVRGVPNAILRSALFSVMKERPAAKRELLASVDGIEVRFTGIRLNQKDLDYFEVLLHLQRLQPLGTPIHFTASAFLKTMGLSVGKYQYDELKDVIARLGANKTEITWVKENKTFGRSLVEKFDRDEETQEYIVTLNPELMKLYQTGYTQIDWEQRQALGKNMLAKALHGLYASHASPFPMKVDTIRTLTGSNTKDLWKFRQQLRDALKMLVEVGAITGWEIDKRDLVHVQKVPTVSQQRHLLKRLSKSGT